MTYVLRCCAGENGLVHDGPLVESRLSPPRIQAEHLAGQGKKIPSVATKLMIDTGAAKTAIDIAVAANPTTEELGHVSKTDFAPDSAARVNT